MSCSTRTSASFCRIRNLSVCSGPTAIPPGRLKSAVRVVRVGAIAVRVIRVGAIRIGRSGGRIVVGRAGAGSSGADYRTRRDAGGDATPTWPIISAPVVAATADVDVPVHVDGVSVEIGAVEVPAVDVGAVEVPAVDVGAVEVPTVDVGAVEVPTVATGDTGPGAAPGTTAATTITTATAATTTAATAAKTAAPALE